MLLEDRRTTLASQLQTRVLLVTQLDMVKAFLAEFATHV